MLLALLSPRWKARSGMSQPTCSQLVKDGVDMVAKVPDAINHFKLSRKTSPRLFRPSSASCKAPPRRSDMLASLPHLSLVHWRSSLVDLFNAKQANQNTIALGQQQQQNADLKGQLDGIKKANDARDAVRADTTAGGCQATTGSVATEATFCGARRLFIGPSRTPADRIPNCASTTQWEGLSAVGVRK